MRIGLDVDMTTLASDVAWWNWLWYMSNTHLQHDLPGPSIKLREVKDRYFGSMNYDLSHYFPSMVNSNVDPFDFWRSEGAYDTITPVPGAMDCFRFLKSEGHQLIFITHNKGNGSRSKYNNLVRHFGKGNFDYVVTREKELVNIDVMFDDRNEFINRINRVNPKVHTFLLKTAYTQTEPCSDKTRFCENWIDFVQQLKLIE